MVQTLHLDTTWNILEQCLVSVIFDRDSISQLTEDVSESNPYLGSVFFTGTLCSGLCFYMLFTNICQLDNRFLRTVRFRSVNPGATCIIYSVSWTKSYWNAWCAYFLWIIYNCINIHIYIYIYIYIHTSSTRTRRGGSCLRFDYKTYSSIELARAVRRACLLRANLLRCCWPRTWPACDHVAMQHQANIFFTLHTALFTPCTSRFTLALHIPQPILSQIIWFLFASCHLIWPLLISSHPFSYIM